MIKQRLMLTEIPEVKYIRYICIFERSNEYKEIKKTCLRYVNKCLTLGKWKRYRIGNIRKSKTLPEIRQQMLNLGKMKTISYREYKEIKNTAWTYVEKCSWLPMVVLPFVKIRRMSCSLVPCYIDFIIFLFSLHTFTFG